MGLCDGLSIIRSARCRAAALDAQIQLASSTRRHKIPNAHQSPRSNRGQPVEAPQLAGRDPERNKMSELQPSDSGRHPIRGLLLDLDGVVHVRGKALPGALEAIARVRAANIPLKFVTNTTRLPRRRI